MEKEKNNIVCLPADVTGNGVACPKRWLVAMVKLFHEKKTAERLSNMGIETYLPVQRQIRPWSDRKKEIDQVLTPMMLFVYVDSQEQKEVLMLSSVSRYMVLRNEHAPAVVPDIQMERFMFLLDHSEEAVNIGETLQAGDLVRVVKGPLKGLEGEFVSVNGKTKIAVRIDLLGTASVDISADSVEKI